MNSALIVIAIWFAFLHQPFLSFLQPNHVIPESTLIPTISIETVDSPRVGIPEQILIPALDIYTTIDPVGLTYQGAIDVPQSADTVGWFEFGPRPGDIGSAIIDGHRTWRNGGSAVFDRLEDLATGDQIIIIDSGNVTRKFIVREVRVYDVHENPPEVFISRGTPWLHLITCNGEWSSELGTATKRLVVFAEYIQE